MNISYYDFKNLSNCSQCEMVMNQGHIMTETVKNKFRFVLYEISTFTVEIVYNISNDKVEDLTVFQNRSVYC